MNDYQFSYTISVLLVLLFTFIFAYILSTKLKIFNKIKFLKIIKKKTKYLVEEKGFEIALLISLCSTISPLLYTHVYNYEPCLLCWYQRIFMFPTALMLFMSNVIKKYDIKIFIYANCIIGLCFSLYHYINQMIYSFLDIKLIECTTVGITPQCVSYFFLIFGFITIPMMATLAFLAIIFFIYFSKQK